MGLLGSIWKLIKKVIDVIFKFLKDIFGDLWPILLIIAVIYFAPYIATYLTSIGAPGWLTTAFTTLAEATPSLTSAMTWLWDSGSTLASTGWTAFKQLDVGTQAAILTGAAALLAPEETEAVISDAVGLLGTGVAAITGGLLSSPVGLALAGFAFYWVFLRDDKPREIVQPQPAPQGGV